MATEIEATRWVYVIVQDPGKNEQIVGQRDEQRNIAFVPTFLTRETAHAAAGSMPREILGIYEIQAIIFEDLARYAQSSGFLIFVLDGKGNILDQITPVVYK